VTLLNTKNICYLVYAYRGGFIDRHNYPIGIFFDYDKAKLIAIEELKNRAGKYGITIYKIIEDNYDPEFVPEIVNHYSSYNKEVLPLEKIAYDYLEHYEK
jgi:hypothetical protein